MTVHDDHNEARVDRVHSFGDLRRRQLVGFRVHDLDLVPLLTDERGNKPGPDRVLNGRQTRAKRLVNTRSCAWIDENHINAV